MANKPYHRGNHRALGGVVVAQAYRTPDYRCPVCGLTLDEGIKAYGEAPGQWDRGHKQAGQTARSASDYEAQHAHCNRSDGARLGNQQRRRKQSRDW